MKAANDDGRELTFREFIRFRILLMRARRRARISEADELRLLERIASGDREGAEQARREAFANAFARALDAVFKEHGI